MKVQVARYDYPSQFDGRIEPILDGIRRILLSGEYILGKEVAEFETAFSANLRINHSIGLNSGTDALILALMSLGIGNGDEVITHANTFYATVASILLVGATPVLVDADPRSFLINVDQVEAAITPRTKALLPVHLYGKPTPMEDLLELATRHGLFIVEDAAQCHGARWRGKRAGTFGDVGCFSFHPSKNLAAAGDGGAAVTNNKAIADDIRTRRGLGQNGQNNHVLLGYNSKLDNIQALVLTAKLDKLDTWNARRRVIAQNYREKLEWSSLNFQDTCTEEEHVYHQFQVCTKHRDSLLKHLQADGVDVVVRYPVPIHLQPAFADQGWKKGQFPVSERLANELLCLPIHHSLSEAQQDYVCTSIKQFFG